MSNTFSHTARRRGPCLAGVLAAATLCIGVSALSAAFAAGAGFGGADSAVVRPAAARLRFYVGPDNPFSDFARRPLQGWFYAYGSPGETGRLNWDPVFEPAAAEVDATLALRTLKLHFEIEVSAFPARTRGGINHFTHTARLHWELPTAFGIDWTSAKLMQMPQQPVAGLPTAGLTLLSLVWLPALRRRWRPGDVTARGSPLH